MTIWNGLEVSGDTVCAALVEAQSPTRVYASLQEWPVDIPFRVVAGGMGATLLIGGLAGLYPALRASVCRRPKR